MNQAPLLFSFILLLGCSPEKAQENLTNAPVAKVAARNEQVVDSVSNTRIDGTATTIFPLDVKQQLPAELEVHLDRTHGLWQFPTLTTQDAARVPKEEQGPYFVQADFNSDKKMDYAIQLMERDSAFVYVFMKSTPDDFREHLLERHPLEDVEKKKRSTRYLKLTKKADKLYEGATRKEVAMVQDGISVEAENKTATYVWENGKFRKYKSRD
jgi:hypothetical protein